MTISLTALKSAIRKLLINVLASTDGVDGADKVLVLQSGTLKVASVAELQDGTGDPPSAVLTQEIEDDDEAHAPSGDAVFEALAEKADLEHGHAIGDVTDLQTALDGKAILEHGHAIGDVTGLQTALDAKVAQDLSGLSAASPASTSYLYIWDTAGGGAPKKISYDDLKTAINAE